MQHAAVALVELDEVIGLQDHVIEFEEGQLLLPLEPQLDGIEGEHAVDGKMPADVAQKIDVIEPVQPIGIVGHDGIGRPVAELEKFREDGANAFEILLDHLSR